MSPWRSAAQAPLVLVVDDQEANIQLMGKVLGAVGFDVMPALSGEQALQRATPSCSTCGCPAWMASACSSG